MMPIWLGRRPASAFARPSVVMVGKPSPRRRNPNGLELLEADVLVDPGVTVDDREPLID